MRTIFVTGATGFIGQALCMELLARGFQVKGTTRSIKDTGKLPGSVTPVEINSINHETDWSQALDGIDTLFHLAARVHIMKEKNADPLKAFREVNVAGTKKLAEDAAAAGVKRIVFVSSIKVNGEGKSMGYTENDTERPLDPYGVSKWEAERELRKIEDETGMETVIIRTPLVYGPEVSANFLQLLKIVRLGIPLPLANIDNRRSFIYVGNLVDSLLQCAKNPGAAGQTFLVSDGQDVSTPKIMKMMAAAFEKPLRIFPLPYFLIRLGGNIFGKSQAIDRLWGSLTIDSSKIRKALNWKPVYTMEEGIKKTVAWYIHSQKAERLGWKFFQNLIK